jgi:hypothetical protein
MMRRAGLEGDAWLKSDHGFRSCSMLRDGTGRERERETGGPCKRQRGQGKEGENSQHREREREEERVREREKVSREESWRIVMWGWKVTLCVVGR